MEWRELLVAATSVVITSFFVWKWFQRRNALTIEPDNTQTVAPEKSQPTELTKVPADKKNGTNTNQTSYDNVAYRNNELSPPGQVNLQSSELSSDDSSQLKRRNISDVSEVFRPPSPDKSLSAVMLEKYDNKSKSLRPGKNLSDIDFSEIDNDVAAEKPPNAKRDVNELDSIQPKPVSSAQTTSLSPKEETEDTKLRYEVTDGAAPQIETQIQPTPIANKTSEWRDKLKLDLDDDDDEEFNDETSDDEMSEGGKSIEVDFEDDMKEVDDQDEEEEDLLHETDDDEQMKGIALTKDRIPSTTSSKSSHEIPLVIDNGSFIVRGGWGGEYSPTTCVRNVIGSWRAEASEAWQEALGSKFIGQTAIDRHSTLALEYPVEDGKIENWRGVQDVLQHVVGKELEADLTQHPILITEPCGVEKKQREKMTEIMIESLRAGGICLKSQAAMCSLSADHPVGMVINSGYGTTEIVPVYSGYPLHYASATLNIGGRQVSEYLSRLIQRERGITFSSVAEIEVINTFKERFAKVSINNMDTSKEAANTFVECPLPDGRMVKLGSELSNCAEPLFSPGLMGSSSVGLSALVKQCLARIDADVMTESENVILLAGGNSKLSRLQARLESDIESSVNGTKTCIKRTSCGDNAAWIGGSLFTQQSGFIDLCVTEDLYFEYGAQLIHRLCF